MQVHVLQNPAKLSALADRLQRRMDAYTPMLLDNGLGCMIGKGARSKEVVDAMKRNTVVYLGAIGGAGALIAQSIKKSRSCRI